MLELLLNSVHILHVTLFHGHLAIDDTDDIHST